MKGLLFSLVRAGVAGGVAIDDGDVEREETERHCSSRDWEHAAKRGGGDLQMDLSPPPSIPFNRFWGVARRGVLPSTERRTNGLTKQHTQLEGEQRAGHQSACPLASTSVAVLHVVILMSCPRPLLS